MSLINGMMNGSVSWHFLAACSLACHFVIKGCEADCKCLQCCHRVPIVHGKRVLTNLHRGTHFVNCSTAVTLPHFCFRMELLWLLLIEWHVRENPKDAHLSKLQNHSIGVILLHQLKILDRCLSHAAAKVETVSVQLLIPLGRLISQHDHVTLPQLLLETARDMITYIQPHQRTKKA